MEVIEQGQIISNDDLKQHQYTIRVLDPSDLMAVMELQNLVMGAMEQDCFCVPLSFEEQRVILEGHGETIGLFVDDNLYAACSILNNVKPENNMARELNFSQEELKRVSQLELAIVHPEFRGNKLQQRLAGILAQRVEKRKRSKYLFTTVYPFNYPSIQTAISIGLHIAKLCKMYHGWPRYVAYKDFENTIKLDIENSIAISNAAIKEQQELLNKGYRGYAQIKDIDGTKIVYAKIIDNQ